MGIEEKHCKPCEGETAPLKKEEEEKMMKEVQGWELDRNGEHQIRKNFEFDDFEKTIDFVNRVADVAAKENHHPDMHISYNKMEIDLSTHAIGGLSENDFIMAAKIDRLQS